MRNLRLALLCGFLLTMAGSVFAQRGPKTPPKPPKSIVKTSKAPTEKATTTMFQGTLIEKPWAKSGQSFCAQGSEYYVLVQADNTELVIKNDSGQDISAFKDKKVNIEGRIETKTIKPSSNPMEQRPVTTNPITGEEESFTCTILVVVKIK